MKKLRIVFMGTPEFAVSILDHLIQKDYQVIATVTAPDKPAGRGRKLHSSALKRYAVKNQLPVLQPKNLKDDKFQAELRRLNPDIAVVVAFRMLPKKVWALPKQGAFNLHASLLPDYRGAAPINWSIINGETHTGVTTFFLDENIDTGKIIKQQKVAIDMEDNAGDLHDKLMVQGAELVENTLDLIAKEEVQPISQAVVREPKEAPKLTKTNTQIDWYQELNTIYNLIRGLNPYPAAWTTLLNGQKTLRCKIYETERKPTAHHHPVGKLIKTKENLQVAVKNGFLIILKMQLEGKKKMPVKELLNGLNLKENAKMR